MKRCLSLILLVLMLVSFANAQQTAEVTISLNEQFFDVLLDAVFTNLKTPSVPLASKKEEKESWREIESERAGEATIFAIQNWDKNTVNIENIHFSKVKFEVENQKIANQTSQIANSVCDESIKLQREIDGVKTAVRFRQGKIYAPIAFKGNYNPPLIGCIGFQGYAETNIELEFDKRTQTLIGRAKVLNVVLSGTGGIGSGLLTRLVQSSIDDKINPLKILDMEKVSFTVPVQDSGNLKMKALRMRHDVGEGVLNVRITYQFLKG